MHTALTARKLRRVIPTFVLALAFLGAASSASAAPFAVQNFFVTPTDRSALAFTDVRVAMDFPATPQPSISSPNPDNRLNDLQIDLAPGVLADPTAAKQCADSVFAGHGCAADTVVGHVGMDVWYDGPSGPTLLQLPKDGTTQVVSLTPRSGQVARLGVQSSLLLSALGNQPLEFGVELMPDKHLRALATNLPDKFASGRNFYIESIDMTLFGTQPQSGKGFMMNPSRCDVLARSSVTATANDGETASAASAFFPTNCQLLPFAPRIDISSPQPFAGLPDEFTVQIGARWTNPTGPGGHNDSYIRHVDLALPQGTRLSPSMATGMTACTAAQFDAQSLTAAQCPASSEIGDVSFESPLLGTLAGKAFLGTQTPGVYDKYPLYLEAQLNGVRVKLEGTVTVVEATGEVGGAFVDLPQVAFSKFTLKFRGGPTAPLTVSETCGAASYQGKFTPWTGTQPVVSSGSQNVTWNAFLNTCVKQFQPTATASANPTTAGSATQVLFDIKRPDRDVDLSHFRIRTPVGLMGSLKAATPCAESDVAAGTCGTASRVGGLTVRAGAGPSPAALPGSIYLTGPYKGKPFGLAFAVPVALGPFDFGTMTVRSTVDVLQNPFRLEVETDPLPRMLHGIPIRIQEIDARLDRPNFMVNPTQCTTPSEFEIEITSVDGDTVLKKLPYQATNCGSLPFAPTFTVSAKDGSAGQPDEFTTRITSVAGQSEIRNVRLQMPDGVRLSPAMAAGQQACELSEFDAQSSSASACPQASKLADVQLTTPLLGAMGGQAYLGPPDVAHDRYPLLIEVEQSGVRAKLQGVVSVDPATGDITAAFDDLPQVPFSDFTLVFRGGSNAALTNPVDCGTHTGHATFTPWSGTASVERSADLNTSWDGNGAPCQDTFAPNVDASLSTAKAAAGTAVTFDVTRPDRDADLKSLTIRTPAGLMGSLTAAQPCSDGDLAAATCGAASRVGQLTASVGSGAAPVSLPGQIYLTGGRGTSPAGIAFVIPARIGIFDLGTVTIRSDIDIQQNPVRLQVVTDAFPRMIHGIPIRIRNIRATLDREGFLTNATSCAASAFEVTSSAVTGADAHATIPYAATDCGSVPFGPGITAEIGQRGETGSGSHPPLSVTINQPRGEAGLKDAKVTLPPALGTDLGRLTRLCEAAEADAWRCPTEAQVGSVRATTRLLGTPLEGNAYLVRRAQGLPGLAVFLRGTINLRLDASIALTPQGVQTTFDNLPDVGALDSFRLDMLGGARGILKSSVDLCRSTQPLVASLGGHNGARRDLRVAATLVGCVPKLTLSGLRVRPKAFRPVAKRRPVRVQRKEGTRITFSLSNPASVRFQVQRAAPGRRSGRKCRRPTKALLRARRCTRWVAAGTFIRRGKARLNRALFNGWIRGHALKPGRYRLLARPFIGTERGAVRSAAFRILAPKRARRAVATAAGSATSAAETSEPPAATDSEASPTDPAVPGP